MKQLLASDPNQKIDIQFVLSDGAGLIKEHLIGKVIFLGDSHLKSELIVQDEYSDFTVHCYCIDPFNLKLTKLPIISLSESKNIIPPIFRAVLNENPSEAFSLIKTVDSQQLDKPFQGFYLLNLILRKGYRELALTILEQDIDVNATDSDGCTPLALAVSQGDKKIVELLLTQGADPNTLLEGRTILSWAIELDFQEIINLLVKHSASLMPVTDYNTSKSINNC